MNSDRCVFSAKRLNWFVCRLARSDAECDGTLHSKMRCPFWNVSQQLCRLALRTHF